MSRVFVAGCGAISPAGWGVPALREAIQKGEPIPARDIKRPGGSSSLSVRTVPPASPRPSFLGHPRLRRSSSIAQFAVGAALEALGTEAAKLSVGSLRLGIIFCAMTGCVSFSRRFCDEMLSDPSTASPLVFPETVFNAPASHLAALLGTKALYYTLVGDPATFLQGVALAGDWLTDNKVDGCLVIGAEEQDWLVTEAFQLFDPAAVLGEGAGALYLRRDPTRDPAVELNVISDPHPFYHYSSRLEAASRARAELGPDPLNAVLCDGRQGIARLDRAEDKAWRTWPGTRISPKLICGDGLMAAGAWQCVTAVDALFHSEFSSANVSIVGTNQQAIAAQFCKSSPAK